MKPTSPRSGMKPNLKYHEMKQSIRDDSSSAKHGCVFQKATLFQQMYDMLAS
jgi:hypothetical protein